MYPQNLGEKKWKICPSRPPTQNVGIGGAVIILAPLAILLSALGYFGWLWPDGETSKQYTRIRVEVLPERPDSPKEFIEVSSDGEKFKLEAGFMPAQPAPNQPLETESSEISRAEYLRFCQIVEENNLVHLNPLGSSAPFDPADLEFFARSSPSEDFGQRTMIISWSTPTPAGGREVKTRTVYWSQPIPNPAPSLLFDALSAASDKYCRKIKLLHLSPDAQF